MSDLICQKCGSKNPAWYADNDLFNKVNGSPDGVLCPMCFQELADSKCRNIIFKAEDMAKDDQSEIQRLTKEVEELKDHKRIAWESAQEHQKELTRLRELLVKSYPYLKDLYGAIQYQTLNELLTDIDNALNPKYNPPYIEGKTDLQNEG